MPNYGHGIREHDKASTSYYAGFRRWLQIKKYQYEVTFSLYMLTPTEKLVFNTTILILLSLLITAAVAYLPNHIAVVSNRLWYYVHGEFLYSTKTDTPSPDAGVIDALARTAAAAVSTSTRGGLGRVRETVQEGVTRRAGEL